MSENRIRALLTEREGYVRRNLPDRVAQVDAELAALGHKIETAAVEPGENAARRPGRPRKPVDD